MDESNDKQLSEGNAQPAVAEQFSYPQCPECSTMLRATDKFCCWCGERQPERSIPYMKLCLVCNALLPGKANFCCVCGSSVTNFNRRKVKAPLELFHDEESEFFPKFEA
jgi:RNA polymerase subunit RPABC4/transcription elongation factor Spt4